MGAQPRYMIEHNGRKMTFREYSSITGVPANLLHWRARNNKPLVQARDAERYQSNLELREALAKKGYPNGYTYEEIKDLYKNFAGQENELRMLMDFTGLGRLAAEDLLGRLKYERSKAI